MPEAYNPVAVENHIHEIANRIAKGVLVRSDTYEKYQLAALAHDEAYAYAFDHAEGNQYSKKYSATLETVEQKRAMVVAEVAWKRAEFLAKALELELGATQSISKSVLATYGAAGVGER